MSESIRLKKGSPSIYKAEFEVLSKLTHGRLIATKVQSNIAPRNITNLRHQEAHMSGVSLKDRIKRFTASQPLLEQAMFHFYRAKNMSSGLGELDRRKGLSMYDIQSLAQDMTYLPLERVIDNNIYGYARFLKAYAGIERDLKAYMEHGLFLGKIVHLDQFAWHFPRIITMSENRVEILKERIPQKEAIAVGPYIHYAPTLYSSQEMETIKSELGKVLLVYPFHSMKNVKVGFSEVEFVEEIKRVAKNYDTVLVSLYYSDALDPARCAPYEAEGFKLVTAGHKFDQNFVARQRAHIELADMTMSNGMGTQTGFCVYLNKPHYIYRQDIEQKPIRPSESARFYKSSGGDERELVAFQRDYFARLFGELRDDIGSEQMESTAKFWGFDQIKSKEELRQIF